MSTTEAAPNVVRMTYSVREAAIIIGVGAATLYRAIDRDEVRVVRVGRRVAVPKAWVDAQVGAIT